MSKLSWNLLCKDQLPEYDEIIIVRWETNYWVGYFIGASINKKECLYNFLMKSEAKLPKSISTFSSIEHKEIYWAYLE